MKIHLCESWGIWMLSLGLPSTNLCEPGPQFYTNTVTNNSNVHFLSTSYHSGTLHDRFHQTSEYPSEVDTTSISLLQVRKQKA